MEGQIWKAFLGSLVRWFIAIIVGGLVSREIISAELAAQILDSAVGWVVVFILTVAPLVWAYLNKKFQFRAIEAGIQAPKTTTVQEVVDSVASTSNPPI